MSGRLGGTLTVTYSTQSEATRTKSRTTLLPLLIVLFLVSYGILTLLVVEQGRTIESQRGLITVMLRDSSQLAALKGKLAMAEAQRSHDKPAVQSEKKEPDSGNSVAAPKAPNKDTKRPGKSSRSLKEFPQKPATDLEDVRRSTRML